LRDFPKPIQKKERKKERKREKKRKQADNSLFANQEQNYHDNNKFFSTTEPSNQKRKNQQNWSP